MSQLCSQRTTRLHGPAAWRHSLPLVTVYITWPKPGTALPGATARCVPRPLTTLKPGLHPTQRSGRTQRNDRRRFCPCVLTVASLRLRLFRSLLAYLLAYFSSVASVRKVRKSFALRALRWWKSDFTRTQAYSDHSGRHWPINIVQC